MTPRQWLHLTCSYNPDLERKATALAVHATRLSAEFPAHAFSADSARGVAKVINGSVGYIDIATALRHVLPDRQAEKNETEDQRVARCWSRFIGRRLNEGGNPAHLFSLLKAHCPNAHLRQVLASHFPDELAEMDAKDHRIAQHQARLRRMAEDAADRMRIERPIKSRPQPEEIISQGPKPRHLSPEHLAAMRAKVGIVAKGAP
jgi:hypothetical protein